MKITFFNGIIGKKLAFFLLPFLLSTSFSYSKSITLVLNSASKTRDQEPVVIKQVQKKKKKPKIHTKKNKNTPTKLIKKDTVVMGKIAKDSLILSNKEDINAVFPIQELTKPNNIIPKY